MKLTPKRRARLAEIAAYKPTGSQHLFPVYRDDATDRALLAAGLIVLETYRIRHSGSDWHHVTLCHTSASGKAALATSTKRG